MLCGYCFLGRKIFSIEKRGCFWLLSSSKKNREISDLKWCEIIQSHSKCQRTRFHELYLAYKDSFPFFMSWYNQLENFKEILIPKCIIKEVAKSPFLEFLKVRLDNLPQWYSARTMKIKHMTVFHVPSKGTKSTAVQLKT